MWSHQDTSLPETLMKPLIVTGLSLDYIKNDHPRMICHFLQGAFCTLNSTQLKWIQDHVPKNKESLALNWFGLCIHDKYCQMDIRKRISIRISLIYNFLKFKLCDFLAGLYPVSKISPFSCNIYNPSFSVFIRVLRRQLLSTQRCCFLNTGTNQVLLNPALISRNSCLKGDINSSEQYQSHSIMKNELIKYNHVLFISHRYLIENNSNKILTSIKENEHSLPLKFQKQL